MLENSRHLLAFCVVCGAIGSYLISIYVLILVFFACILILVIDSKLLDQATSAIKDFTIPVPSWIKSIITSLMNSYHLSKPIEPEPNSRRSSPFSQNVPIPRRPSCRPGRYTCLDENTDYVNRRNGIGLCNPGPVFNNNYPNSLHGFRRHSGFSDADSSSKIEEFSSPQSSPWVRRQNYSGNEFSNVRRVQTIAGPLLATAGLTKRKSNDFGLYVDANSPGLASRIVQYREEGVSAGGGVWTHQPQYDSPGQFPMVHLSRSPSSLPVLSPLSSQKASRRSVRVKIAPPDPLGSRLYPLSAKSNASYATTVQTDHSTKSVLETLKEISRKRIHSQLEDSDDDAAKRQKRNGPLDVVTQSNEDAGDAENMSKRLREESPRQQEQSPPVRPAKRICNNEILSSLSSSRKLLQGGGIKRKTQNLDWSRCSTPVLGKQQKTTGEDVVPFFSSVPATSGAKTPVTSLTVLTQALQEESHRRSSQNDIGTQSENERRHTSSFSLDQPAATGKETQKRKSQVTAVVPKAVKKAAVTAAALEDTPWQKDSPFVSVSSPDDIIDDVSALEEKREQDRRSRLLSMMTVISGGEPPVKIPTTSVDTPAVNGVKTTFTLGNNSSNSLAQMVSPELFASSAPSSVWSANAAGATVFSVAPSAPITTQNSVSAVSGSSPPLLNNVATSPPMFSSGGASLPGTTPLTATSAAEQTIQAALSPPTTSMNAQLPVTSVFESPSIQVSAQQNTPVSSPAVFGSTQSLFGSKTAASTESINPFNSQPQPVASTLPNTVSSGLFNFTPTSNSQISFGVPSSVAQPASTAASTPVTAAVTPVTSSSPGFQLRPAMSGLRQDNTVSSSSGVFSSPGSAATAATSAQTNVFAKPVTFEATENQSQNATTAGATLFGAPANLPDTTTSSVISSFVFGNTATSTPTSGSQIKPGLFSFGNTSTPNEQTGSSTDNAKSVFGSATSGFGQPLETSSPNAATPSQSINPNLSQPVTTKTGGFKFDLPHGKLLFPTPSQPSSSSTTFGKPSTTTVGSEPKPFAFGSAKPVENPFALSSPNNSTAITSQTQIPVNLFGSPTVQQKQPEADKPKESLFAFGSNPASSSVFSTPQAGFSAQPTATTTTTVNSGFGFQSSTSSGFSQSSTGTSVFSMPSVAAPTSSFAAPATSTAAASSAFTFGSAASNPTPQSNMFGFGTSATTSDTQPSSLFSFGNRGSAVPSASSGLFGQPAAPAAAIQSQAIPVLAQAPAPAQPPPAAAVPAPPPAPASAFQFGSSGNTQQLSGTFSFGSSSNANTPTASGFSSGGSFQVNSGSFGGGPTMFSIGSGSTAPRVRSARTRRTK